MGAPEAWTWVLMFGPRVRRTSWGPQREDQVSCNVQLVQPVQLFQGKLTYECPSICSGLANPPADDREQAMHDAMEELAFRFGYLAHRCYILCSKQPNRLDPAGIPMSGARPTETH